MAINVFTNVSSLNAQRNLANNSASMSKSLQRLSSGMRINTAADDAAGLTISQGLTAQVRGLNQASRNASDGLSMLGTAESAISSQTDILQRMRELAVQASSDTNNGANRTDINNEVTQLKTELNRIANTTSFNGNNLLDGSYISKDLQVGANATSNDRINITLASNKGADLGSAYKMTGAVTTTAITAGQIVLNGTAVGASVADGVSTANANASALAKANAVNAVSSTTNITADADTTFTGVAAQNTTAAVKGLTINGVTITDTTTGISLASANDTSLMNAINSQYSATGVTASLNSSNNLVLNAADGRNVVIAAVGAGADITSSGLTATAGVTSATQVGTLTLRSTSTFSTAGSNAGALTATGMSANASLATTENVQALDLTSKSGAQLGIKILDVALSQLNSRRASIGALTNRLNSTISNLSSASENASAANSRIMDADFASETAAMSRSQVLQQAGVAILAQANQAPQLALSLLR